MTNPNKQTSVLVSMCGFEFQFSPAYAELVHQAYEFAKLRHGNQKRKYTNKPYITHPVSVAHKVYTIQPYPDYVIAAIFHDLVEDTDTTIKEIDDMYGYQISSMVAALTKPPITPGNNRASRTKQYISQLRVANDAVKLIKLADILDNIGSIVQNDPKFASLYINESIQKWEVIKDGMYNEKLNREFVDVVRYSRRALDEYELQKKLYQMSQTKEPK